MNTSAGKPEQRRLSPGERRLRPRSSGGRCVHELFEIQADRTPGALAVVAGVAGAERRTFGEIEARANRLAHHLRGRGVGPDTVVGLCVDRRADLVVGLLGILKAGGAYLPLDPTLPRQRLAELIGEAGARDVVTVHAVEGALPEQGIRRVCLDAADDPLAHESDARPLPAARPHHLVYVLFTSGSTGRPKGVAVEHRNLVAYVRAASERLALPPGGSYAHVSSLAADLGNTSLFPPLCLGGTLHLVDEERTRDPDALGAYFEEQGIDAMKIAPSHLSALLSAARPERVLPRRAIVLGGEALSWDMVERIERLAPGCRVYNHYGPTETTVGVVAGAVSAAERGAAPIAPLGRPLASARIYVLDERFEPAPLGVPGEVLIGGAQVARGYLNQPGLTAERFVPDPFDPAGARVYRTGDRACWLADGALLFLGRADHQVKIRGYRVELGEIEAALGRCPGVRDAAVIALDDGHDGGPESPPNPPGRGGKRLAAFAVTAPGAAVAEILASLAERLPGYMVPGSITALDAFPLLPNGKVDRRALAALERREGPPAAAVEDAPRGPVEEVLEAIWADVFEREHVGVHERFDALGGHSLLAIQLIARVRDAFQVEVPLRAIFEAPTIAELAGRVEALRREGGAPVMPPIERAPRDEPPPLSFAQERLWFLDRLEPGSALYNVPSGRRLSGPLDAAVLERALREVVRRHEVLRTTFAVAGSRPVQVIHDEVDLRLPVEDVSGLPEAQREARIAAIASAEARLPFDLERGPVVRARLLRLGPEDHVLWVVLHHIASDAWTQGILHDEVARLYGAFARGAPSPLPPLPLQYADYAAWQRRWLSGAVLDQQLAWWRAHLAGAPDALELPADRPRPPVISHRGRRHTFTLDGELHAALGALGRREGATLFMVLLAAFYVLLARSTGQRSVVVGTPIAGRTRAETESLIGFFINTLALHATVDDEEPFRDLLARVREACLGAYDHQDLPFERLVEELRPARDLSRTPIFQAMLILQTAPREGAPAAGLSARGVAADGGTSKFDVTLSMIGTPRGLAGTVEYATDLFDGSTIERMVGHLRVLCEGIVEGPERRVIELPLLSTAERDRVLVAWNDTGVPYAEDACIHALVEAQAALTPSAVAVASGGQSLTYGALDLRSNRLARYLRRRGVGPASRVAICVERSVDMVVGLLGILKAGAAYVPMDPTYPRARLALMVADAGLDAAVTQEALGWVFGGAHAPTVKLDTDRDAIDAEDDGPLGRSAGPGSVAYVIYTSGSTGTPKGVEVPHRAVVAFLAAMRREPGLGAGDCLVAVTSLSFDIAGLELWLPLTAGARVEIAGRDVAADGAALAALLERAGATVMQATPSTWRLLLDARGGLGSRRGLLKALVGGEAVPRDLADALAVEAASVWNMYGPTETTIWSTVHRLVGGERVLIGRPIANTRVYVLDGGLSPAPIGVPGELYIGGAGLARGYLRRPALAAERFLPDPFAGEGARMYRTGDLARWLPAGVLECLGRVDAQVKLRGFRIEPGEVEAALAALAGVREAVVVVREDAPGDRRLVAYVVPADEHDPLDAAALRAFARERLPEYMVPSAFVALEALPLTPNGKVDRRALPAPELPAARDRTGPRGPRGPVEEAVAGIFAEVLRLPEVGADDGFFELGGHSLLATQVVSRVQATFGVALPVRALFEAPTAAELATRVEAALRGGAGVEVPPVTRAPRGGAMALSFGQERLWFLQQLEPDDVSYLVPAAIRLDGALDREALARTIDEVVRRHEVLRTRIETVDGSPVAVVDEGLRIVLAVERLADLPEAEREPALKTALEAEARRPFDLGAEPPIRVKLFVLGETDHVLSAVIHHVATDAWSMGVLQREIAVLYDAFVAGRPSPLPELPVQYADHAAWQRAWLTGEVLDRQLAWWKAHLSGAPIALELPADRPRAQVMSHRGARHSFTLSTELHGALGALGRREGATLFMVVLAAFDVLLSRYTGQRDVVVGTPIAGRTRAETEGLIGLFVNTLALRAELDDEQPFAALLARVREACLGAYTHQDLPFERLVDALSPVRDLSRTPLFQAMLVLQNAPQETLPAASLRGRGVATDRGTAMFELELALNETPRGLLGTFAYASDLFDAATIERMAGNLGVLLEGIVARPDARIVDLPIITEAERARLLVEWTDTRFAYPDASTFPALFEAQVERVPDAIAVCFEERQVTYRELNRQANRLAHQLRSRGVGADSIVALFMDRGIDLLIAALAVFKAGGAYLPLDPDHPAQRLVQVLERSEARWVVATRPFVSAIAGAIASMDRPPGILSLDDLAVDEAPEDDLPSRAGPGDLAYVIFTSGSTGVPKGAMVEHRGMLNHLYAKVHTLGLSAADTLAQTASQCFDISVWQLLAALLVGGRVQVFASEIANDPPRLLEGVEAAAVSILEIVPSLLRATLDGFAGGDLVRAELATLRWLILTGEALPPELCRRWLALYPSIPLLNAYGPTECSDDVTHHAMASPPGPEVVHTPIGRSIINTRLYVLDRQMAPVPTGVHGELYVGGVGVGRGYLNDPARTAEVFVPDPFAPGAGARLYRTGDLVRYLPQGDIEFLGRIDHQVKLRGYRIELGEIESALGQHPSVRDVVVVAREDAPGGKRLVAYVVPRDEAPPDAGVLRAHLQSRLPEYMVPSAFVVLAALPLTSSGKIDRKALPAPELPEAGDVVAPRGPVEEALARVWQSVLHLERVGVHDNFFALGGDSILSIQLVSRAAREGIRLTPRQIFQHQTIAELAVNAGVTAAGAIEGPDDAAGPVPLTPIQSWFFDQDLVEAHHWNQAVLLEARERIDDAVAERVVAALLDHHDALSLRFARVDGAWTARIAPRGDDGERRSPLSSIDLGGLPRDERRGALERAAAEAQASLDLAEGPILRVILFHLGEGEADRVLLAIHHLAIDGVSWRVLLEDFSIAFEAIRRGEPPALPPRTTSFKRWAERLAAHARGPEVGAEAPYWLADERARVRPLLRDRPGGESTVGSTSTLSVALDPDETRALLQEVPRAYNTQINDALLTALLLAVASWTGGRSTLVDLEGHGREELFEDLDLTRTVGWFTSLYPVLLELPGADPDPGEALTAVKEQLRAVPGRGVGYGLLRYLRGDAEVTARLRALPQAEVSFNYLGQLDQAVPEDAGLSMARETAGRTRSPRGARTHLLDVGARVLGGRLQATFAFGEGVHRRETIEALAQGFLAALRSIVAHCAAPDAGGYTPSDFDKRVSKETLARLAAAAMEADSEDFDE